MSNEYDNYLHLLNKFDGSEPFMNRGYRVIQPRHKAKNIPAWALDDKKVQEIVLRSFPKLATNMKQRARAARWVRIIFLYFRREFTVGDIANIMGTPSEDGSVITPMSLVAVKALVRTIKRAAVGKRADGSGEMNMRGRHRPMGAKGKGLKKKKLMPPFTHIMKGDRDQENP